MAKITKTDAVEGKFLEEIETQPGDLLLCVEGVEEEGFTEGKTYLFTTSLGNDLGQQLVTSTARFVVDGRMDLPTEE